MYDKIKFRKTPVIAARIRYPKVDIGIFISILLVKLEYIRKNRNMNIERPPAKATGLILFTYIFEYKFDNAKDSDASKRIITPKNTLIATAAFNKNAFISCVLIIQ